MEYWIKQCKEYYGRLSWEGVSKMIKTMHRYQHEFIDLTQRENDLAFGLKEKKENILFTHTFLVISHYVNVYGLFNY